MRLGPFLVRESGVERRIIVCRTVPPQFVRQRVHAPARLGLHFWFFYQRVICADASGPFFHIVHTRNFHQSFQQRFGMWLLDEATTAAAEWPPCFQ